MIYIYNTLTNKKEKIISNINNNINIYVCGITVYDECHVGHIRLLLIFDILIRYLKYLKYNVIYVRNITDIDDKIIEKSNLLNINYNDLTNFYINKININLNTLDIIKPNYEPKVTNHINDIINVIKNLIEKKNAYIDNNKNILFNINSYKNYGILSNRKKNIYKNFILWKNSYKKKRNINDYNWISPWCIGRPGWHIECSTISNYFFNNSINIHGGGIDLLFPHHENELAQSKSAFNNFNIKLWMHIGQVNFLNKKMSKSTGNYIYIKNIYNYFHKDSIRYYLSFKDYKKPLNFNFKSLIKSNNFIKNIYLYIYNLNINNFEKYNNYENSEYTNIFIKYMDNDLNLSNVYSLINYIFKEVKKYNNIKPNISKYLLKNIIYIFKIIGLLNSNIKEFLNKNINNFKNDINNKEINNLINKRNIARKNKNWILSDKIRNFLYKKGIILYDKNNYETIWELY